MKALMASLFVGLALAGCTAPVKPTGGVGLEVSGDGIRPSARIGVRSGPLTLGWRVF